MLLAIASSVMAAARGPAATACRCAVVLARPVELRPGVVVDVVIGAFVAVAYNAIRARSCGSMARQVVGRWQGHGRPGDGVFAIPIDLIPKFDSGVKPAARKVETLIRFGGDSDERCEQQGRNGPKLGADHLEIIV